LGLKNPGLHWLTPRRRPLGLLLGTTVDTPHPFIIGRRPGGLGSPCWPQPVLQKVQPTRILGIRPSTTPRPLSPAASDTPSPALGPPLPIPPPSETLRLCAGFSRHPLPSVTLHRLHMAPRLMAHRHRDQMGPWQQASHACKPFFISVDPSPLPTPHGHGHGSRGTLPRFVRRLGLRVSSRGQRFSLSPPFFSEATRPLHLLGPTLPWPTRLLPARSTHWCWCPIKVPIRGIRPASRLPPAGVAPPYSASLPHPFSCLSKAAGRLWPYVLGTERPTGLW